MKTQNKETQRLFEVEQERNDALSKIVNLEAQCAEIKELVKSALKCLQEDRKRRDFLEAKACDYLEAVFEKDCGLEILKRVNELEEMVERYSNYLP
jgi:hypothetical protein